MKIQEAYREFLAELKSNNPITFNETIDETTYKSFEQTFTSHLVEILHKDEKMFENSLPIFGVDLSDMWSTRYWKYLQRCYVLTFLNGNVHEKIREISPLLSSTFSEITGKPSDDIDNVLNDDAMPSKVTDIIEFLKDSVVLEIGLTFIEITDLSGIAATFKPDEFTPESIHNNPELRKLQDNFKSVLQEKIRSGEITQQQLGEEMNTFALKFQSLFGDLMTGVGRTSDVDPAVLLGSSPEARRARMIARLRRKAEENKHRKNSS
jgi:hypothetical protein